MDRARQAHADPGDLGAARVGLVEHLADEPRRERDRLRRREVGAERLVALREHAVGQVGERDPQVALAEVEPERDARRAVERHEHERPADPAARHGVAVDDEPLVLQLGDDGGDGRGGEGRPARQLGA